MINVLHSKTKKLLFSEGPRDFHYLLLNILLAAIIVFPIAGTNTPIKNFIFDALFVTFILYGLLLLKKPSIPLVISGLASFIVLFSTSGTSLASLPISGWLVALSLICLGAFFLLLGFRLFRDMLKEEVSLKLIYISIANYFIIGIAFNFMFHLVHLQNPNAFNFSPDSEYSHVYMSFIILTSVGLGDLLPLTSAAKALVIMDAIAGQLYLTFFVAIIVGKYLSKGSENKA